MNKKLTRLTALLLAVLMMMSTFSTALADTGLTKDQYIQSLQQMQEDLSLIPTQLETPNVYTTTVNTTTLVPTYSADEGVVTPAKSITVTAETAPEDVGGYQWQIYVGGVWANIQGETAQTLELTYAMAKQAMDADNNVQLRCRLFPAVATFALTEEEEFYEDEITAKVNETVTYTEETKTTEITVTQYTQNEEPDDAYNAAWELQNAAKTPAVSTYALTRAGEESGTENGSHTIIVQYLFTNGTQAANPWSASVANGSELIQTVKNPEVTGYEVKTDEDAPVNGFTLTADSVSINLSEVTGDITYTVWYVPSLVKYTVKHYWQNVNDNKYTLYEEETEEGYTGDEVPADLAKEYPGFYALLYEQPIIKAAADGSTEVEIYYDRFYYTLSLDLNGGYGANPIYTRYGAEIQMNNPTRVGYTFAGWEADKALNGEYTEMPTIMPAQNLKFTAIWTPETVTYDVVFWYENADDNKFTQAGVLYDQTATAGSKVNGSSFANANFTGRDSEHFTYAYADEDVVVKGDGSTVVNVYFSRNEYTLTFSMGSWANSCSVEEHRHSDACRQLVCDIEAHNHATEGCEVACTHTTHTLDCYTFANNGSYTEINKPNYTLTDLGNGIYTYYSGYRYCLNIGDKWYQNSRSRNYAITFNCSHTHSDSCYSCGKTAHTHVTGCYDYICGQYEHYHSGNTCYLIVTKKYDADITDVWENNPVKGVIDAGYVFESSATGDYYSFLEKMPGQNITMTKYDFNGSTKYTWYYYLEILPGQDTTGLTIRTDNGKTYYLYHTSSVYAGSLRLTYDEDYFPITGFTQRDTTVPSFNNGIAYLYYIRNSYDLTFNNHGTVVSGKGGTFLYEADISGQYFEPDYPSTLEPDAYVFEGWYTSPFFGDTKFEFTTTDENGDTVNATMPAHDLTLYARWVKVEHNVRLFLTQQDMEQETNKIGEITNVKHGEAVKEEDVPEKPTNGEYEFVGWFYMDGNTEKAFDFSMQVTQDLNLYAKWSSNKIMPYTVHYAIENDDGTLTYIADSETGSGLAGTTKTFEAKTGEELYEGYQSGYFPTTNSHSIVIDIDDASKNEYTFIYVPGNEYQYTVKYLLYDGDYVYNGTETVLHEDKVDTTSSAIITENFVPITGYRPDAYQKRLVVSSDESKNLIIFWYAVDKEHAPVKVIHYIQNAVGDGYTEYQSVTDLDGVIGKEYTANILNITGFDFDHATANGTAVTASENLTVSGTVTESGLLLELYYNRELHPYEFRFVEQGTNTTLADPVTGTDRYGSQVRENAKEIPGYTLVSDNVQRITIQIEDRTTAVKNVKYFYYTEDKVTIDYRIVDPNGTVYDTNPDQGCGELNRFTEGEIGVLNGPVTGSAATANTPAYKFVGWFKDAACTSPVDADWVDENGKITPAKTKDYDATENGVVMGYESATYYAKFEYNTVSLTINKTVRKEGFDRTVFYFTVYVMNSEGKYVEAERADGTLAMAIEVPVSAVENSVTHTGSVTIGNLLYVEGATYKVEEHATTGSRYTTVMTATNPPTEEYSDGEEISVTGSTDDTPNTALEGIIIPAGGSATVNVTNTASDYYDVTVTKVWDDDSDALGYRPDSINLTLSGKGQQPKYDTENSTFVFDEESKNTWKYTWNVPKYDANGNIIEYTVAEGGLTYYNTSIDQKNLTVTNSLNVGHLKLEKKGLAVGESAIFNVTATRVGQTAPETWTIVLTATKENPNPSVTIGGLKADSNYTVAEDGSWVWSYTVIEPTNKTGTIVAKQTTTVTYTNTKHEQWLYDESSVANVFNKTSTN